MEETQLARRNENLRTPKTEQGIEFENEIEEGGGNRRGLQGGSGSLRTRSQVAPDWTAKESMILVNEVSAVEVDCGNTLSSFQKWKIIVENCNALEVNRNLNQCRRKWESLLADYYNNQKKKKKKKKKKTIEQWESQAQAQVNNKVGSDSSLNLNLNLNVDDSRRKELGLAVEEENFDDTELFQAIGDHLKTQEEGQCQWDTEPDSDPDAELSLLDVIAESGSKKQKRSQKRSIEERAEPWRRSKSEKIKPERCSLEEKIEHLTQSIDEKTVPDRGSLEKKEQMVAAKVRENAELINAILKGNFAEDVDYRLADLKNVEAFQTGFTRRQGDRLIVCLGNLADTLDQLCDLVQESG